MIEIDKSDFIYKSLVKLGEEDKIENQYLKLVGEGISNIKDLNRYLQANLGMDYMDDFDEQILEEVVDYYHDLKKIKKLSSTKLNALLKEYQNSKDEQIKSQIISSQLQDTLLMACSYKLRHMELNLADLVQVANMGLMCAITKYKSESRIPFSTYLAYWVLNTMIEEFNLGE